MLVNRSENLIAVYYSWGAIVLPFSCKAPILLGALREALIKWYFQSRRSGMGLLMGFLKMLPNQSFPK